MIYSVIKILFHQIKSNMKSKRSMSNRPNLNKGAKYTVQALKSTLILKDLDSTIANTTNLLQNKMSEPFQSAKSIKLRANRVIKSSKINRQ